MKAISKVISTLFAFCLFLGVTSCLEKEPVNPPSPSVPDNCIGVFFPSNNKTTIEMEPTEPTEMVINISRTDSTTAVSVPVTATVNDDNVFVVPQTVPFAANQKTTQFKVTFPNAVEGKTYNLELVITGDEFANPYMAGLSMRTKVIRVKWSPTSEPFIFIEPVGNWGYAIPSFAMYVETESTTMGNTLYYRLKNTYHITQNAPDADGIYDGYPDDFLANSPYTDDYFFDDSEPHFIKIEIDEDNNVFMPASKTGFAFDSHVDGMVTIGSIYKNINDNISKYPLGTLSGDIVTFPESSIFVNLALAGTYVLPSTKIYRTKEAYLADNRKIRDFNNVEYEDIPGAVSEFESKAYGEGWSQSFGKAIDIDAANPDSEYKNLYILPDLYAEGYVLAFYYDGETVRIPANQPIGKTVFGHDLYISQSTNIVSTVTTNSKGVTIYTLGVKFQYKDGTVVGEFPETYYYSKNPVSYAIADFYGNFTMTGSTQFTDGTDANMSVKIAAGAQANTFAITGIKYAAEVEATFDPATSTMSIAPQALADYGRYDMTLYTTTPAGDVSETATMDFNFNMGGKLVMTPTSEADGYLLYSNVFGGWADGYYNLAFTPKTAASSSVAKSSPANPVVKSSKITQRASVVTKEKCSQGNFKVQPKVSPKKLMTNVGTAF